MLLESNTRPSRRELAPVTCWCVSRGSNEDWKTRRRAPPVPRWDRLDFPPFQPRLNGNGSSLSAHCCILKGCWSIRPAGVRSSSAPRAWFGSPGPYCASQTRHQAAIAQLKHFLFHDNFISLPDSKTFSILLRILGLLAGRSNAVLKCTYFKIDCLLTPVSKPGWKAFYPQNELF